MRSARLIAHRGNLYGPSPLENNPRYVQSAYRKGFDVEIDVWWEHGGWWLGHDAPKFPVSEGFLTPDAEDPHGFWCHAKNKDAFERLRDLAANCFWHDADEYVVTNHGFVWCYPNAPHIDNGVWNQPEWDDVADLYSLTPSVMNRWVGVCTDYAALLKSIQEDTLVVRADY